MSSVIVSVPRKLGKRGTKENGLEAHRRVPNSEDLERGIAFNGLPGRSYCYTDDCNT